MIKIVLAIVIVVLLGYLGYGIERYYKTRLKILRDYKNFIAYVGRETEFFKSNIEELAQKFEYQTKQLNEIISSTVKGEKLDSIFLTKELISRIVNFITELSNSDYHSKNAVIKNAEELATQSINDAEKDKTQKGELGRKLIILLGIGLIVLII